MHTILRIDASSRGTGSVSRSLGDHFEATWLDRNPRDRVIRRDVAAEPIRHIADRTIAGFYTPVDQFTDDLRDATALSDLLIDEIREADVLLLTLPMHNFSLPSALKAWIDQIVRLGHTFAYDGTDFTGLVTDRRAYVVCAFGVGGYLDGGPLAGADFVQPYLSFILSFLGIQDVRFFAVEGTVGDGSTLAANTERVRRDIDAVIAAAAPAVLAAA
jgi:FMN-dependent NADH-azoreductase